MIGRALAGFLFAALATVAVAEDAPDDTYRGLFASDPGVCEHAARTDLSDALFELNASAIIPYEELIATELHCEFTRVEPEPAAGGFELFAFASCTGVVDSYEDVFWIVPAGTVGAVTGASISVNSKHLDEAAGETTFTPFYRCDDLDPETVKR